MSLQSPVDWVDRALFFWRAWRTAGVSRLMACLEVYFARGIDQEADGHVESPSQTWAALSGIRVPSLSTSSRPWRSSVPSKMLSQSDPKRVEQKAAKIAKKR
jgi:hypothetical protein